jgi:hypothetical protein
MSAITSNRQWLMDLLGPEALADLDLDRRQLSDQMLALLDEAFAGNTPVADLVLSALGTDGAVVDEDAYARLMHAVDGAR